MTDPEWQPTSGDARSGGEWCAWDEGGAVDHQARRGPIYLTRVLPKRKKWMKKKRKTKKPRPGGVEPGGESRGMGSKLCAVSFSLNNGCACPHNQQVLDRLPSFSPPPLPPPPPKSEQSRALPAVVEVGPICAYYSASVTCAPSSLSLLPRVPNILLTLIRLSAPVAFRHFRRLSPSPVV